MVDKTNYSFSFMLDDIESCTDRVSILRRISDLIEKMPLVQNSEVYIDYHSLYYSLTRYSKDVYGIRRIDNMLKDYINSDNDRKLLLEKIKNNSGMMLETLNPHLNKEIAYLTYHLACLKPFSLKKIDKNYFNNDEDQYSIFVQYFNEIIIYFIVRDILNQYDVKINIKRNDAEYFLHCLKYRNITRSYLEFIFEHVISNI